MTEISKEELRMFLRTKGLTNQQIDSSAVQKCIEALMPDECSLLVAEAERQVSEMKKMLFDLQKQYRGLADTILEIRKAQIEYGSITDNRAQNALALYASLMAINQKVGVMPEQSSESVGYILYAYLGGQAKREITYEKDEQ